MWGPTCKPIPGRREDTIISIHGPRVGADGIRRTIRTHKRDFNPRPPCGGRHVELIKLGRKLNFNPRPPCGGRLCFGYDTGIGDEISIHGPRVGADVVSCTITYFCGISIHGPRVGADKLGQPLFASAILISIHGPRVGADMTIALISSSIPPFQSTAPVWGPTNSGDIIPFYCNISIHGPRVGADLAQLMEITPTVAFQSTAPVWGPTQKIRRLPDPPGEFQSTAPVWGPTPS